MDPNLFWQRSMMLKGDLLISGQSSAEKTYINMADILQNQCMQLRTLLSLILGQVRKSIAVPTLFGTLSQAPPVIRLADMQWTSYTYLATTLRDFLRSDSATSASNLSIALQNSHMVLTPGRYSGWPQV
jgi:hypothetical protein